MATLTYSSQLGQRTKHDVSSRLAAAERAHKLANWMDNRFRIPGTQRRVGLDGMLGLIPGIGDAATTLISTYIIGQALKHNLPKRVVARMGWNWMVDSVVGAVPLVGDLFDFAWKANTKNAALLAKHLGSVSTTRFG